LPFFGIVPPPFGAAGFSQENEGDDLLRRAVPETTANISWQQGDCPVPTFFDPFAFLHSRVVLCLTEGTF